MELPSVPSQELADSGQVEKRVRVAEKRLLLLANHLHHRLEGAEGRGVLPAAVWSLGTGGERTSATRTRGEVLQMSGCTDREEVSQEDFVFRQQMDTQSRKLVVAWTYDMIHHLCHSYLSGRC